MPAASAIAQGIRGQITSLTPGSLLASATHVRALALLIPLPRLLPQRANPVGGHNVSLLMTGFSIVTIILFAFELLLRRSALFMS